MFSNCKKVQKTLYKAIIFDLDGTILDTLEDIKNAVNITLKELGYDLTYTYDEVKHMIGNGSFILWERATKPLNLTEEELNRTHEIYLRHYLEEQGKNTYPFKDEEKLLKKLKRCHLKLFVYTNKPHNLALDIISKTYGDKLFELVIGHKEGMKVKPNGNIIDEIARLYSYSKDQILYIGDSHVDIETAKNAGVKVGLVTFGYDTYTESLLKEADYVFNSIDDLNAFFF